MTAQKPVHPESKPVPVAETTEEISDVISQLETHKKAVVIAILGAAVILSLVIVFRGLADNKHLAAAEAYSEAAKTRTVENLDQVIADYPNSVAAGNALLTKAELQTTSGKSEDAQITLLTFIEKYQKHPRHTQGLLAMGNLYQVGGDADKASSYYDRILKEDPESELAPFAMIRQGDLLLAAGKTDEARLKYESIMPAYRGSAFFERIEEKIELSKVKKLPVVPEPKKPTPKPATKPTPEPTTVPAKSEASKPAKSPASKSSAKKEPSKKPAPPKPPAGEKQAPKPPKN